MQLFNCLKEGERVKRNFITGIYLMGYSLQALSAKIMTD